ncbi:MAG: phospholipase B family protein [Clostridia bacterium]|nr:phospholipase B family protein [Clostridia bacterium]
MDKIKLKEILKNASKKERNGWIYLHIEGDAYTRGFQHGYLAVREIEEAIRCTKYMTYWNNGMTWEYFVEKAVQLYSSKLPNELKQEINGIADGAKYAGFNISSEEILTWNVYMELTGYWFPTVEDAEYQKLPNREPKGNCSAFIAVGSATKGGKIVMAHNSWDDFVSGQFYNFIIDLVPEKGNGYPVLMQAAPGYVHSNTDYFVTGAGLMGTETTIGGFQKYDPKGIPEFIRIRMSMQYANTLDQFVETMLKGNNGGYANSWLLADCNSNEILRLELGLKFHSIERTKDGFFIGFNAAYDPRIRNLECSNSGFGDIRRHQGARQVRLTQLMRKYYGRLDVSIGKKILADHYDVYLNKENPCSRTIDGHYELDARETMCQPGRPIPYQPRGTYDGKVTDSDMGKNMSFIARWGNSSGMPFDAADFLEQHIQWEHLKGYLKDRPSEPWTEFRAQRA